MACGNLLAEVQFIANGILIATGVRSATIKHVEKFYFVNTSSPGAHRRNTSSAPADVLSGSYLGHSSMFDAYWCTIFHTFRICSRAQMLCAVSSDLRRDS